MFATAFCTTRRCFLRLEKPHFGSSRLCAILETLEHHHQHLSSLSLHLVHVFPQVPCRTDVSQIVDVAVPESDVAGVTLSVGVHRPAKMHHGDVMVERL